MDKTFEWLLDLDGDLYGDEQERRRWYEAITATANLQWMIVPWVAVICLFVYGRPVALTVCAILLILFLLSVPGSLYVKRGHVRAVPEHWSTKRIVIMVASRAPYVLAVIGVALAYGGDTWVVAGALLGAMTGGSLGLVGLRRKLREQRASESDPVDVE